MEVVVVDETLVKEPLEVGTTTQVVKVRLGGMVFKILMQIVEIFIALEVIILLILLLVHLTDQGLGALTQPLVLLLVGVV